MISHYPRRVSFKQHILYFWYCSPVQSSPWGVAAPKYPERATVLLCAAVCCCARCALLCALCARD